MLISTRPAEAVSLCLCLLRAHDLVIASVMPSRALFIPLRPHLDQALLRAHARISTDPAISIQVPIVFPADNISNLIGINLPNIIQEYLQAVILIVRKISKFSLD